VADRLLAWLYGTPVCVLERSADYRISLKWLPDAEARWGFGSRILSVSLPLGVPLVARDNRALDFFENLLPEGPTLDEMARLARLPRADTFGILAQFGRDCAGAVTIAADGETPAPTTAARYAHLSDEDLARALRNRSSSPLGADLASGYRPSLAGFQRKLLVGRASGGSWARPLGDSPSTWILKPDGATPMATNEFACLQLARAVGLEASDAELVSIDGVPTLVVRRYDRAPELERIHQEDGCQATGSPAGWKYEYDGGPTLKDFAGVLRDFGTLEDLPELLRRVAFNVVIGNADAHAKNFSVLHQPDADGIRLAPVYDVLATVVLASVNDRGQPIEPDRRMGQRVGQADFVDEVTREHLVSEGASWGLRPPTAGTVIDDTLGRISSAKIPDSWLADLVSTNLDRLG
jgi:serine/threonine-protein kinase HipA